MPLADVKWIKITTDMFDNRKIKHLRRLPDGDGIVLIWVMLLTMAGRCNSGGMIFLTENIPYTTKMLADELDFEESTVQLALTSLERLGMIQANSEGFLAVTGWEEHQNIAGLDKIREQTRKRVAKHRAQAKLLESNDCGNVTVTDGNAADKKEDKNKKEEKESNNSASQPSPAAVDEFFDSVWALYPVKKGKGQVSQSKRKALYKIGFDELNRAITRYLDDLQKDASWRKPQNGSTFFNSGYVDYLDANYTPTERIDTNGSNQCAAGQVPLIGTYI